MPFAIVHQIFARTFIWIFLLSVDIVAPELLRQVPKNYWYGISMILATIAVFWTSSLLGKDSLIRDIQELCLYDVLIQVVGLAIYLAGGKPTIYIAASYSIGFLKYTRLLWPCRTKNQDSFVRWPTFGLLGLINSKASENIYEANPSSHQKNLGYIAIGSCLIAGTVIGLFEIQFNTTYFCLFSLLAIPLLYKRVMIDLQHQYQQFLITQEALHQQRVQSEVAAALAEQEMQAKAVLAHQHAALQAAHEELKQAKQLTEKLMATMRDAAHDLRPPLALIGHRADRLLHADGISARTQAMTSLTDAIEDMKQELDDTIYNARLATHVAKPQRAVLSIVNLSLELLDEWTDKVEERGLDSIRLYYQRKAPLMVICDQRLIKRILRNLLLNAIEYGKPNGKILISLRQRNGGCWLQVWDNGPGMSAETDTADTSTNFMRCLDVLQHRPNQSKGFGLGLRNVWQLCQTMDIDIHLRSRLQVGTVFSLMLPLASENDITENALKQNAARHQSKLLASHSQSQIEKKNSI